MVTVPVAQAERLALGLKLVASAPALSLALRLAVKASLTLCGLPIGSQTS